MDNGASKDLDRVVTWQFDDSPKFLAVIDLLKEAFKKSTEDFWNGLNAAFFDIDTANSFGLSIWGRIIGIEWPTITKDGSELFIKDTLYRKIIKARFVLLADNASFSAFTTYFNSVFESGITILNRTASDDDDDSIGEHPMSVSFSVDTDEWEDEDAKLLISQHPESIFIYPCGVNDAIKTDSFMFGLADSGNKTQIISDYPNIGGLDESSFTWTRNN